MASSNDTLERYKASMVLSGAGDALGYKNQEWEYCKSGVEIHKQLAELGGLSNIQVELPGWPVSDDTVMHLATGEALVIDSNKKDDIYREMCKRYVACMKDMEGRKPGPTSILGCEQMSPDNTLSGWHIPFNPSGTGCGAAMRAMCIGLRYPRPDQLDDLIAVSVESGRMTHHNPHGYCGALASALFVSYSVQGKPLREWGKGLLDTLPRALEYVKKSIRSAYENEEAWFYFPAKWEEYLEERGLLDGTSDPKWPDNYDDPGVRDKIYKDDISSDGWPGRRGHDAPLIAYDALLAAGDNWGELCSRSMFHGGDSDSTGVIAAACFGVLYGYHGVPECNHNKLEYRDRLEKLGEQLYQKSHP